MNHAGLIVPFELIRLSQLAALFGDVLVGKARNVLDAKVIVARHPAAPILLVRIEGHVVGDDPAAFWRDNADLATVASQALPRQVFMYYAEPGPPESRREGFLVAQRGQVLTAQDATLDRMPPGATEADWPVARLCEQLRVTMDDLAEGFPTGPSVEIPLVDASVDDQALLEVLAGQQGEGEEAPDAAPPGVAPVRPAAPPNPRQAAQTAAQERNKKAAAAAEEDAKRRAREAEKEAAEQAKRAQQARSKVPYAMDELGIVLAPAAELSEAEILASFITSKVAGDPPEGVPAEIAERIQGKRVDIAVRVEFLSEVFIENSPLNKAMLEERGQSTKLAGNDVTTIEVLGPRLGYGTLVISGKQRVFVSRKPPLPLPEDLVATLLANRD